MPKKFCFLGLIFHVGDGSCIFGFLKVNELLADGGVVVFSFASAAKGDASAEQQHGGNGNDSGLQEFFHVMMK